ncbi:hypothetical protein PVK06_027611 [Gossypium arboreum]|uniref:Transmembrane protein n=1 Tax=Gossypium arboreum TaxID=29729 RepID=A0ABR0P0R4_GOSAR|nr:hypothetical protein PVK06_027611 [Gossypium arboreum]
MAVLRFCFVPILVAFAVGMIALPVAVQAQSPALAPTTNDASFGIIFLMLICLWY